MNNTLNFIYKSSVLGFLISIFLCFPLWHGVKEFPLIPVFDMFASTPQLINAILVGLLLFVLFASLLLNKQKLLTPLLLICYLLLIFIDVNRFRPEFYFFSLVLLIVYLHSMKKVNEQDTFLLVRILLSAVYIFAGLNKLNDAFSENLYEPMMKPMQHIFSKPIYKLFLKLGMLVPLIELFIGVGLWIPKMKHLIWKVSLVFHVSTLIILLIHNFNYTVYSWNIAMVIICVVLCKRESEHTIVTRIKESMYLKIALFPLVILPASHFVGLAGSNLSFDVYSGKYAYTYVYVFPEMYPLLPENLKKCCVRIDAEHDDYKLFIDIWAQKENKASIYYEDWALHGFKKHFQKYSDGRPIKLVVLRGKEEKLIE
jgi:hypothetical protein